MKKSIWTRVAGVAVVAAAGTTGSAALTPVMTDLGTLTGYPVSHAYGINSSGEISGAAIGADETATRALLFTGGTIVDLGTLGGSTSRAGRINESGQIAGTAALAGDVASHAVVFENGTITDLGTLEGGVSSVGWGINAAGDVAGFSSMADGELHAFRYDAATQTMTDLGTLGGAVSIGYGINDSGDVVGYSSFDDLFGYHAFLHSGGSLIDLGTLGGTYSFAYDVNDDGHVVGEAELSDGTFHAFLHANGTMIDLGTLGGDNSTATTITDDGQILGESEVTPGGERHAFLWSNGTMTDLGTLGGAHSTSYDMNAAGQIVGWSGTADGGPNHAFFLELRDLTPPVVACPGDLTLEATSASGATATFSATASDDETASPTITYSHVSGSVFPIGITTVTATAQDEAGNTATCTFDVTVSDTTAPTIASVAASPNHFGRADHELKTVTVTVSASDAVGIATCRIVSVANSQADSGLGLGDQPNDVEVTGDLTAKLRAEDYAALADRTYTITVECEDAAGNAVTGSVDVTVARTLADVLRDLLDALR
jgi:probable HAF family extracellular repeat protein